MGVVFLCLVLDFGLKYLSEQGFIRRVLSSIVSVLQLKFLSVPVLQCNPGWRCNVVLPLVTMGLAPWSVFRPLPSRWCSQLETNVSPFILLPPSPWSSRTICHCLLFLPFPCLDFFEASDSHWKDFCLSLVLPLGETVTFSFLNSLPFEMKFVWFCHFLLLRLW